MNITYPNGTWPAVITDTDIHTLTAEEVQEVGRMIANCALVVFKKQKMSIDDEVSIGNQIGQTWNYAGKGAAHSGMSPEDFEKFYQAEHRESSWVSSVTGALDKNGLPGLHGMDEELGWHCGQPWNQRRPEIVSLYSVYGSVGSTTSYLNSMISYQTLSNEWKEKIKDLKIRPYKGFDGTYSKTGETFNIPTQENTSYQPPVFYNNSAGNDCIFLPFNQMAGFYNFPGTPEEEANTLAFLKNHITQEEYIYHHEWDDGDFLMWDNWTGLHMRAEFAGMKDRLLHRMQFTNEKIKF